MFSCNGEKDQEEDKIHGWSTGYCKSLLDPAAAAGNQSPEYREYPSRKGRAGVGVIGRLHAVVPFAESTGGIAGSFEILWQGLFIKVEPLATGRSRVNTAPYCISPGKHCRPGGRTDRINIKPVEMNPIYR